MRKQEEQDSMDDYAYVLMGIMINMERLGATLIDEPKHMLQKDLPEV